MCLWKSLVADVNADRAQVLGCSRSWMLKRHSQLDQWCVCPSYSVYVMSPPILCYFLNVKMLFAGGVHEDRLWV